MNRRDNSQNKSQLCRISYKNQTPQPQQNLHIPSMQAYVTAPQ